MSRWAVNRISADDVFVESVAGELHITRWQGIPLVRYNLHDAAALLSWRELLAALPPHVLGHHAETLAQLPDVIAISGRADRCLILCGTNLSESMLDAVRRRVTYPVIRRLAAKYASQGGIKIVVQTTGDVLTDAMVADLMDLGVWMISVASVDDFHVGLEGPERQKRFVDKLSGMFERHGLRRSGLAAAASPAQTTTRRVRQMPCSTPVWYCAFQLRTSM